VRHQRIGGFNFDPVLRNNCAQWDNPDLLIAVTIFRTTCHQTTATATAWVVRELRSSALPAASGSASGAIRRDRYQVILVTSK